MGLAKTGGIASNGSGDYVIAFSTAAQNRVPHDYTNALQTTTTLMNDDLSPLFMAAIEATEEAIINSMFKAETMVGKDKLEIKALPLDDVIKIMKKYGRIKE